MIRANFNADWSFALQGALRKLVEENFPNELHRWPLLQTFDVQIYSPGQGIRILIFRDKAPSSAVPSISSGSGVLSWPTDAPEVQEFSADVDYAKLIQEVRKHFHLDDKSGVFFIPEMHGVRVEDDWENHWPTALQPLLDIQLESNLVSHLHFLKGLSAIGNFTLPPGYEFLAEACRAFFNDHPNFEKNVFLMTRFESSNRLLVELDVELRRVLREAGYDPVRADDKVYAKDRNLWNNVCIYMLCCKRGVAILEDRAKDEFNPNVALEYGFMRALNREALLFADIGFRNLRADIIGTLREEFDITDIEGTVGPAIERWFRDF